MQTTIGYCALSVIVFETVLADGVNEKKNLKNENRVRCTFFVLNQKYLVFYKLIVQLKLKKQLDKISLFC
jgi:hypothetical protein